jgi:hypothetical protein
MTPYVHYMMMTDSKQRHSYSRAHLTEWAYTFTGQSIAGEGVCSIGNWSMLYTQIFVGTDAVNSDITAIVRSL